MNCPFDSMMKVYYNDNDRTCAAWIKELMAANLLPQGFVDDRDIRTVKPEDLAGYFQCHFFAGIGGWPYALSLAGWTGPVWTASLPCQPFSCAGKGLAERDERHLWPAFRGIVEVCRPATIFGEQVASKDGRAWFDGVRADLETLGYVVGAADLCAAGCGAPHIRQRLYWVAHTKHALGRPEHQEQRETYGGDRLGRGGESGGMADIDGERFTGREESDLGPIKPGQSTSRRPDPVRCGPDCRMADSIGSGLEGHAGNESDGNQPGRIGENAAGSTPESGSTRGMGDPSRRGFGTDGSASREGRHADESGKARGVGDSPSNEQRGDTVSRENREGQPSGRSSGNSRLAQPIGERIGGGNERGSGAGGEQVAQQENGPDLANESRNRSEIANPWSDGILIPCADGKARRIKSGLEPLVDGLSGRVGLLRGYGNAIVPAVAAEFVKAYMETRIEDRSL